MYIKSKLKIFPLQHTFAVKVTLSMNYVQPALDAMLSPNLSYKNMGENCINHCMLLCKKRSLLHPRGSFALITDFSGQRNAERRWGKEGPV